MNIIWIVLIIISILFAAFYGSLPDVINGLFDVPLETLMSFSSIASVLIIYSGVFKIAEKAKIVDKVSVIFNSVVSKLFIISRKSDLCKLISTSILCNMLGLGALNTPLAIKIVGKIKEEYNENEKMLAMYLLLNISSFTVLPLSMMAIRESYSGLYSYSLIIILIVCSFFTTLFSIFLVKVFYK